MTTWNCCDADLPAPSPLIGVIPCHDGTDIICRLAASHISVTHQRVIIIYWVTQRRQISFNIAPSLATCSVPPRQGTGIRNVSGSAIICGKNEMKPFLKRIDVGIQGRQLRNQPCRCMHICLGVEYPGWRNAERKGRLWHYLHQSTSTSPRISLRIESRLLTTLCGKQFPVAACHGSIFSEQVVPR